jgi:superfamily I DNA/RNA helicase
MYQRFKKLGGDESRFESATFHGYALKRLLAAQHTVDLGGGLSLDLARVRLLNEFGRQSVFDYFARGPGAGLNLVGDDWGEELSREINQTSAHGGKPFDLLDGNSKVAATWRGILAFYARESLLDFDTVLVIFEYLLRTDEAFRGRCAAEQSHLIVDEFQDTNGPQLCALRQLAGHGEEGNKQAGTVAERARQVLVVGDDFQSIYKFRGAVPGIFGRFAEWAGGKSGECRTLPLRTNWRSGGDVLNVVNAAARRLGMQSDHAGLSATVLPELVQGRQGITGGFIHWQEEFDPAAVVKTLLQLEVPLNGITVLSQNNATALANRDRLRQAGIPCELISARPLDVPGVRRYLALLTAWLSSNRPDLATWWFLASTYAQCSAAAFELLWQAVIKQAPADNAETLQGILSASLGDALQRVWATAPEAGNETLMIWALEQLAESDPVIARDSDTCNRIARLISQHPLASERPLQVLGEMTRKDFAASPVDGEDSVKVSTIHQYKGLENDAILLVYDFNPFAETEKMRVDYVARSRASRWLVVANAPVGVREDWV